VESFSECRGEVGRANRVVQLEGSSGLNFVAYAVPLTAVLSLASC
jgi:hypothetical protein